jgi:hypothetical protein
MQQKLFSYLFQRDLAAFWAISLRFLAERAFARAFPPFNPPNLPNATAAGFLAGLTGSGGVACPVDCWTILKAVSFKSLLERLGISHHRLKPQSAQAQNPISRFKTYHYHRPAPLATYPLFWQAASYRTPNMMVCFLCELPDSGNIE